eukprot:Gb_05779 [translate_table: standard]
MAENLKNESVGSNSLAFFDFMGGSFVSSESTRTHSPADSSLHKEWALGLGLSIPLWRETSDPNFLTLGPNTEANSSGKTTGASSHANFPVERVLNGNRNRHGTYNAREKGKAQR